MARSTELRESTAGMLNNTTVLDHRVRVELVNRLPHPATVEVRERVPVTSDPDVRIEERPGWSPWSEPDHPAEDNPPSARVRRVELPAVAPPSSTAATRSASRPARPWSAETGGADP